MEKKRKDVIETQSVGFIYQFFSEWNPNELTNDFGLDFQIVIFEQGISTKYTFCVQLKSTQSINIKGEYIKFNIDIRHLVYFCDFIDPVLLIVFDAQSKIGYYLNIFDYCTTILENEKPNWRTQKHITLNIPLTNRLSDLEVVKNDIIDTTKRKWRYNSHLLKWYEGYELFLSDPEKLEKIMNKKEQDTIEMRFHTSQLYFYQDDLQKTKEQFEKVYNMKREDENQLKAILGYILSQNIILDNINSELSRLCQEGIELARKLNSNLYANTFTFFLKLLEYIKIINKMLPMFILRTQKSDSGVYDSFLIELEAIDLVNLNIELDKINQELFKNLNEFLEQEDYRTYLILLLHVIKIGNYANEILIKFIDKSIVIESIEKFDPFIKIIEKLSDIGNDNEITLYTYFCLGGYYSLYDKEVANDYYNKGLKLAQEIGHKFYLRKFNQMLSIKKKNFEQFSYEAYQELPIKEALVDEIVMLEMKIESIPNGHMKEVYAIALSDLDPTDFLKSCKYLAIWYKPSSLGIDLELYSIGRKTVICLKKVKYSESANLSLVYKYFKEKICRNCTDKNPRKEYWCFNHKILLTMESSVSITIQNIKSKK